MAEVVSRKWIIKVSGVRSKIKIFCQVSGLLPLDNLTPDSYGTGFAKLGIGHYFFSRFRL